MPVFFLDDKKEIPYTDILKKSKSYSGQFRIFEVEELSIFYVHYIRVILEELALILNSKGHFLQ